MKYGNKHYAELPLAIYESPYDKKISTEAKSLYVQLKVLENKYCSGVDFEFYQTDEQLADLMKWSLKTLRKYKNELKNYPDLITIKAKRMNTGKQVTFYKIK